MEIVSDMIIKFTADDISDMLFEKIRKIFRTLIFTNMNMKS